MRPLLAAALAFTLLCLTAQAAYAKLTVGYYPVEVGMLGWVEVRWWSVKIGTLRPSGVRVYSGPIATDEHGAASYRAFNLLNSEVEVLAVAVDERGKTAGVAFKAQLSLLPLVAYALAVGSALTLLLG